MRVCTQSKLEMVPQFAVMLQFGSVSFHTHICSEDFEEKTNVCMKVYFLAESKWSLLKTLSSYYDSIDFTETCCIHSIFTEEHSELNIE